MKINSNVLINVDESDIQDGTFEIPSMVMGISDWAFQYSKKLRYIKIPETVKYLGHGVFDNCINLKEVYIPKSITELPYSAFNSCDSLEKIEVSKENKKYYSRNGVVYSKDLKEIVCCPPQKERVIIPKTVTIIKRNAFMGCNKLTNIILPNSLKEIEGCAFSRCTNLTQLELPSSVKTLDYFSFFCSNIKQIYIKDENEIKFDYNILLNCSSLKSIVILGKNNKGIPIPNSAEVYSFLINKKLASRKDVIEQSNNDSVKAGLSLYMYENEKLSDLNDNFYNNIYNYGKFIIDNSSDMELKNILKSKIFNQNQNSKKTLEDLKKLQQYYKEQKTIELDLNIK